MFVLVII